MAQAQEDKREIGAVSVAAAGLLVIRALFCVATGTWPLRDNAVWLILVAALALSPECRRIVRWALAERGLATGFAGFFAALLYFDERGLVSLDDASLLLAMVSIICAYLALRKARDHAVVDSS